MLELSNSPFESPILPWVSWGETHYSLEGSLRTQPSAVNLVGSAAYDGMLWGDGKADNPLYGYYRAGIKAGGNPNYAAFLQIAPVAPLIFEIQRGDTHRFSSISSIDCDRVECKGKVERTDYSVKLLLGKGNIVFSGSALWRELATLGSTKPIGLESELFVVTPGFHRYFESNLTLGYKLPEERLIGVTLASGLLSEGQQKMSSLYSVYQFVYQDFSIIAGIGQYWSQVPDQGGVSGIIYISREWGERLSLF